MGRGEPVATVASVASFFLSRIDTKVDKLLDGMTDPRAKAIHDRTAETTRKPVVTISAGREPIAEATWPWPWPSSASS